LIAVATAGTAIGVRFLIMPDQLSATFGVISLTLWVPLFTWTVIDLAVRQSNSAAERRLKIMRASLPPLPRPSDPAQE
jgi:hypothetical protein